MIREAIVLAGGMGTRLRSEVPDLPKCMAPVAGRPFLYHVIQILRMQGIERFIFSLGYLAEVLESYLKEEFPTLHYSTVTEDHPLGTGGGVRFALQKAEDSQVLVTNGDTIFKIDLALLEKIHFNNNSWCTLALKPMKDFSRYGTVILNEDGKITAFKEKQYCKEGLINGGTYLLNKMFFLDEIDKEVFSFEKDFLEQKIESGNFYGSVQDGYFIDIGIPEDFRKAQMDLKQPILDLKKIDKSWTLFLDRDGVINNEKKEAYIQNWDEFVFTETTLEAVKKLTSLFARVIVVTNQRGIGKGLMTENDLFSIHDNMKREIEKGGGKIDAIYFCSSMDNRFPERKPNPGMAIKAKKDFNEIDFSRSIMVGNKMSDMRFGRAAGMFTIFLSTTDTPPSLPNPDVDLVFASLGELASAFQS